MINALSGYNPYSTYGLYGASMLNRAAQAQGADKLQNAQRSGVVATAQKVHQPDTPVQPVTPVRPVSDQEDPAQAGLLRFASDPAEMAVRMRIQYPGDTQEASAAQQGQAAQGAEKAQSPILPGAKGDAAQLGNAAQAAAGKSGAPAIAGLKNEDGASDSSAVDGVKSAQEVMEEAECQTCEERKYQDGSDDPGVSFKTPTSVAPEQAAAAVRGHENEHVVREQAKAQQEDRKVVSQSVTYHTDICPECGKVYVSGGETRTVTKANTGNQAEEQKQEEPQNPNAVPAAVA